MGTGSRYKTKGMILEWVRVRCIDTTIKHYDDLENKLKMLDI